MNYCWVNDFNFLLILQPISFKTIIKLNVSDEDPEKIYFYFLSSSCHSHNNVDMNGTAA